MAYPQPGFSGQPRQPGSPKRILLGTVAVVTMILVGFNGLIIWIYQNAGLGLAASIGIFLAGLGLAAIRRRGGQLALLVGYIQALMIISIAVTVYVSISGPGLATGLQAGGITFGCLATLSVIAVWHFLSNAPRTPRRYVVLATAVGTTLAVTAGSFIYLRWDFCNSYQACSEGAERTDFSLVHDTVTGLISTGQHYNESSDHWFEFMRYTCSGYEDSIREIFDRYADMGHEVALVEGSLRVDQDGDSAIVTAEVLILDNYLNSPFPGAEIWTFELSRISESGRWCVHSISGPDGLGE